MATGHAFSAIFLEHRFSCHDNSMGWCFSEIANSTSADIRSDAEAVKHSKLSSPTLQEQKTHVEPASNRHFKIQMSLAGTVQGSLDSKFKLLKVEQTTNIKCLRLFARHFPDKPYVCNCPFFHMFGQTRKFHNATHNPSTFYMLVQNNEQCAISVGSFRYVDCSGNVERCFVHKSY